MVPVIMAAATGQNRPTMDFIFGALNACQRFATTTGRAISVTGLCAGSTNAIKGTVSSGVPTPSVPFMSPPQASAKEHHSIMSRGAFNSVKA